MTPLNVTLSIVPEGVQVDWRLTGRRFEAGDVVGELPDSIAGAPTLNLADDAVTIRDDAGPDLAEQSRQNIDDEPIRRWTTPRPTVGDVRVSYLAAPPTNEASPATPPLELRSERYGFSGALKCFLLLPTEPEGLPRVWLTPDL